MPSGENDPEDELVEDDERISPEERLFFRVINTKADIFNDPNLGRERPTSGSLEPDSDGVSVYLESDLVRLGLSAETVASGHGNYRVAWITVASVREVGLGVVADRNPSDAEPHPCNEAHHLIKGLPQSNNRSLKKRQKLAKTGFVLSAGNADKEPVDNNS